jgi:uncharacterized protein (TIGR02284 family)
MTEVNRENMDRDDVVDTLEKLIETCRDGQNGFRDSAEHVKDLELKAFFNELSLERARFAGDLENEVVRLGKSDPDRKGSATAALHRTWIDLKSNLGGGDGSILSSAETGEDNAKKNYQEALEKPLPSDILGLIRQQAQSIFSAHDKVKLMRDRRKAA